MTTADLPMLLPPAMVEDPSPLNVSTFAKPEYAKLTFTYGKVKSGGNWPVHCKWFKVRIPTGRQASALTSEPTLIRYELTWPANKRKWDVTRNTTDPNQVVFTCSPPPDEPAAFDGTWSVQLELWGIEVNGGVGPVDIIWEESTSATGVGGPFQERTGKGGVSKRDDSFYLHSFRPASVAIGRNTKATLLWEGTPHAEYTMYYRKPDGTQGSSTAKDGTWTSPENLVDDTSFTLEAKMKNEVRYLTTYIKVNNPDIAVTSVTAASDSVFNGHVTQAAGKVLRVGEIRGPYNATAPNERPLSIAGGALTISNSSTEFSNAVIAKAIRSPENGVLTIENMPNAANVAKKVKTTFADGVLSVTGNGTYSGAISTITIAASEINGRGAGVLGLNGTVTVTGALGVTGNVTAGGNRVLRAGDTLRFLNVQNRYLSHDADYGRDHENVMASRTLYTTSSWKALHVSSATSLAETPESDQELPEPLRADQVNAKPEV
ncbi:hypothetical protein E6W39_10970 [Kitasatospora acidiphila]|uniref:Uncharacterized protein n=1 Tax=Kitasatospora acidiphila TaxID=2567942 RepID=A0A540W0Z6_9ACTN|nr:hypothetical protein [Kitasatospora acidiphila]TQF02686.1 hypothetical protein E6W39_10970 [Kitasatospora acidiphila]